MKNDDMDLLQRWRGGDREAGDTLIRRHYGYALGIAKKRLRSEAAAADATQDAMTVIVQKRDKIETNFRAYLVKVVYFTVLNQTKARQHDELEGEGAVAQASAHGPLTRMAQREEEKLLVRAMRGMSIDDQLVFYYDFVSDKTRMELAELLGLTNKDQIYKRVTRARERLRKELEVFRDSELRQSTLGGLNTWIASLYRKAPTDRET